MGPTLPTAEWLIAEFQAASEAADFEDETEALVDHVKAFVAARYEDYLEHVEEALESAAQARVALRLIAEHFTPRGKRTRPSLGRSTFEEFLARARDEELEEIERIHVEMRGRGKGAPERGDEGPYLATRVDAARVLNILAYQASQIDSVFGDDARRLLGEIQAGLDKALEEQDGN